MSSPPVPLSQYVLKIHSRCDLACDHCYVYESADQSWRGRPVVISDETVARTAQRIAEHASAHELDSVQVILHGGEPLLAGKVRIKRIATELESALRGISRLDLRIHTNGVQLDEEFCDVFAEHNVKVGISIDGDRAANDRHRRYADGRSSYDKVIRAIGLLSTSRFRHLFAGLLCTIDIANDPVAVYETLTSLYPPRIDFLLPHATWDNPPVRTTASESQYADWLTTIFDRWLAEGRPVQIRTFDSVISTLTGGDSLTEALGLAPVTVVIIETDGSYEQVDSLKAAFDGAPVTGLDVFTHSVDVVGQHPGIAARQQGLAGLCQACQACPVVTSCGGGLYTHRYRAETGFDNPSVFCADLLKLITHIRTRLPEVGAVRQEVPTHDVSCHDFRALASGLGDAAAIAQLIKAQRSLRRVLIGAVYQAGAAVSEASDAARAALQAAWTVLVTIDRERPDALACVLAHPYVRAWAVRCLEQLTSLRRDTGQHIQEVQGPAAVLGHLGAIAAASALRAGVDADVTVPVIDAGIHLPTLGRLVLGPAETLPTAADKTEVATIAITGGTVSIWAVDGFWTLPAARLLAGESGQVTVAGTGRPAEWQPVRTLRAPGLCVALEDTDPYRDCHRWRASPRLTDSEFAQWQRHFEDAWLEIQREHSAYAPALAAGLSVLMPLSPPQQPDCDISATARHAFGAVAVARPADPATLALLLINEFQHVKLGAILDLYDLCDPASSRPSSRPSPAEGHEESRALERILQDTYAQLAVTDVWRARQEVASGAAAEVASQRFAYWRTHAADGIETLVSSGSLTPLGLRFVNQMRRSVAHRGPAQAAAKDGF